MRVIIIYLIIGARIDGAALHSARPRACPDSQSLLPTKVLSVQTGCSRHMAPLQHGDEGGGKPLFGGDRGEQHPWEAPAILAANTAVVFLLVVILFFVILDYMPDPKKKARVVLPFPKKRQ